MLAAERGPLLASFPSPTLDGFFKSHPNLSALELPSQGKPLVTGGASS
jgi:hypothetical protein